MTFFDDMYENATNEAAKQQVRDYEKSVHDIEDANDFIAWAAANDVILTPASVQEWCWAWGD